MRLAWGTIYTLIYLQFAASPWLFLLLPVHFLMGLVHGAIINWYAHRYGYTNSVVNDTAKNLLPFDFLMMGESYHNNHHRYGGRANFSGFRWHEFDPAYPLYPLLKVLDQLHVVTLRKGRDEAYM